jgi:hypothetical protein
MALTLPEDIMLRRTKEFDRSNTYIDSFIGILPDHHLIMKTNDTFKQHRRWLQDLMTHDFLHQVAAPRVYSAFEDLVNLWEEKMRLAEGHPFAPVVDLNRTGLDAVWCVMFGANQSNNATRAQTRYCASIKTLDLHKSVDMEAHIPHRADPAIFQAVTTLVDSVGIAIKTPVPATANWILGKFPYVRNSHAFKKKFLAGEVEKSIQRLSAVKDADDTQVSCAIDEILRREMILSEKEGRAPLYHSRGMYDEVFNAMY